MATDALVDIYLPSYIFFTSLLHTLYDIETLLALLFMCAGTAPITGGWIPSTKGEWGRALHDDVIKWKHFPRYWPFVRGIHGSPVNSPPPHKGQWRGALMFSLIYAWVSGWVNNVEAGDLRRHRAYYDVIVMNITRIVGPNKQLNKQRVAGDLSHHDTHMTSPWHSYDVTVMKCLKATLKHHAKETWKF